jgi:hypothetical protein
MCIKATPTIVNPKWPLAPSIGKFKTKMMLFLLVLGEAHIDEDERWT